MELACPPEVEASIYMGNFDADLYDLIPNIDTPVVVLGLNPEILQVRTWTLRRRLHGLNLQVSFVMLRMSICRS